MTNKGPLLSSTTCWAFTGQKVQDFRQGYLIKLQAPFPLELCNCGKAGVKKFDDMYNPLYTIPTLDRTTQNNIDKTTSRSSCDA